MQATEGPIARQRKPRRTPLSLNSQDVTGDSAMDGIEGMEDDDLIDDNDGSEVDDRVPEVGMVFKNHHEVSRFYKRYARRVGFGIAIRRSAFTEDGHCLYLELMCCKGGRKRPEPKYRKRNSAKTNCPARIKVKLWGDGMLHLVVANIDHNHPVSPSMARFLTCYRQLSGAAKKRAERNKEGETEEPRLPPSMPIDRLSALEELLFSESEHRSFVERGRLKLGEGDAEALRLFFTRMQAKNTNFYNVIDLDDEGCMRNVFWADARSRAAHQYYNDVVLLDTTYVINKYDLPLATFVGVNHHGQLVLLGCCLLSDETMETYTWLFKAWIACMYGEFPKALITDQSKGIQGAVAQVLPNVRHRMCLSQIMKKVPEKLGGSADYRAINKAMQKAVYDSLTVDDFEDDWRRMVEIYGLQGNEWIRSLYECRHLWVPVYLKDTFWAGMSTTQRNETMVSFFDGHVEAKTSLKQFLGKYEMALLDKYEKEAQADFETFHKRRPSVSKFYMEEQLSRVYTLNMFKKFQDEIEAIMYCHASFVKVEGPISTFDVRECIFLDDGKRTLNKNHGVLYNTEEKEIQCICGSFQFRGVLCRHALSVLKLQQVHEIPSQYVIDRWKKDFKRLHVLARSSDDIIANNRVDRYDYLSMRCLQLVEVGVLSDKYQLALRLIKEMEKFLLSDTTYDDTQPKIKARIPKANRLMRNRKQIGGTSTTSENGNAMQQRGLIPQLSDSHPSQGIMKAAEFQVIPTPYLATQIRPQPNTKPMEGGNPTVFPRTQFSLPLNGNQAAVRPGIVYMFPGGFDPQTFGNGPLMPWIYQPMLQQATQNPKDPPAVTGLPPKRRKIYRNKPVEATQDPKEPPVGTSS
ncbi:protein FAR1-RELATED SEQUENCE 6-like [Canna indica]|uniref:Protein FAR1-RELATED SEQUENCE n=1 Tax=Canna indica TaxID=4628 RepID=A0AAQ3Q926_9LILI|nr:protein FAR1-RELATED SEQUENCE 6-like [Canna indica]